MLHNSRQRQVILEELLKTTSHPSAGALHELVRKRMPHISLATVYRNLDLLTRLGQVKKLAFGGEACFDAAMTPHHHIRCLKCGRVDDIEISPLQPALSLPQSTRSGFLVQGCTVEYLGICPHCREDL